MITTSEKDYDKKQKDKDLGIFKLLLRILNHKTFIECIFLK